MVVAVVVVVVVAGKPACRSGALFAQLAACLWIWKLDLIKLAGFKCWKALAKGLAQRVVLAQVRERERELGLFPQTLRFL